ncbi:helix-turn-helix domain-containing protein [Cupriavidus sp. SK-3]|uniref:helix-turn-helix domain-containing protein n=1 Tax=Cupriavidus sp. SK-3 TaxID=1470558 RepID=UPI001F1F4B86|nr:helix-turn-helix domain-containing protein [Cupriavidus sp. SK-3]
MLGRPPALTGKQEVQARERLAQGQSISSIARDLNTSRQTIMRLRARYEHVASC